MMLQGDNEHLPPVPAGAGTPRKKTGHYPCTTVVQKKPAAERTAKVKKAAMKKKIRQETVDMGAAKAMKVMKSGKKNNGTTSTKAR
jgi:hypothetical protein